MDKKFLRINVGCGQTPTPGWMNFDNSLSVRIAKSPLAAVLLTKTKILKGEQKRFVEFAKNSDIKWANAIKHIPLNDLSVEVLYSCHMVEHLDRDEVNKFLKEAFRVLVSGGIIRIAIPDLKLLVDRYHADGDADAFVGQTYLAQGRPKGLLSSLRQTLIGYRHHLWMYDGPSMCKLLLTSGFLEPTVMPSGTTQINNPGKLNLQERHSQSVYVEAIKP